MIIKIIIIYLCMSIGCVKIYCDTMKMIKDVEKKTNYEEKN